MAEPMNVKVVSPEQAVYEGPASSLVAPAWDGRVGILPGHAPMLTLLGAGELSVDIPGGGSETFYVAGGVLKVEAGMVTVLTEYAGTEAPESLPDSASFDPSDLEVDGGP